jgi:hypothetical protein
MDRTRGDGRRNADRRFSRQCERRIGKIEAIALRRHDRPHCLCGAFVPGFSARQQAFAIPWSAFTLDAGEKRFILNIAKERLENAPGFDKDHWPSMADSSWATEIHAYYDIRPYWDEPLADDTSIYGRERDPRTTAGSINPKAY